MPTEFSTEAIAAVLLLFAFLVLGCLVKASSRGTPKQIKDSRKAANLIQRLEQEICELTDHCSDALHLDMRRVRWNLLMARVRHARAISAFENDDLVGCFNWLSMARRAIENGQKRFYSAPECQFSGQSEVTINYLNGNW